MEQPAPTVEQAMPVTLVGSVLELLEMILGLVEGIVRMAETAKQNKKNCSQLKDRVVFMDKLLEHLKATKWTPDTATHMALDNLRSTLESAHQLVHACQRKKGLWKFIFSTGRKADLFAGIHAQIDRALHNFHITNLIVAVRSNYESFFMNVLQKLLQNGACRRLPLEVINDIRSQIGALGDCSYMSQNDKMMLELINTKLNEGSSADRSTVTRTSSVYPGEGEPLQKVIKIIVDLANDIVNKVEAEKHSKKLQRLVNLAQRVLIFMHYLRAPRMLRGRKGHRKGQQLLDDLRRDLEKARDLISSNHPHGRSVPAVPSSAYAKLQAESIHEVSYKIESYLQGLLIVIVAS